jgi:hypothetical protein
MSNYINRNINTLLGRYILTNTTNIAESVLRETKMTLVKVTEDDLFLNPIETNSNNWSVKKHLIKNNPLPFTAERLQFIKKVIMDVSLLPIRRKYIPPYTTLFNYKGLIYTAISMSVLTVFALYVLGSIVG